MPDAKRFVYIIQSIGQPAAYYVGLTSDVGARLSTHNGPIATYRSESPLEKTCIVVGFDEEQPAILFEKYLKTGSGREFARRHFRQRSSRRPT